MAKTPKKKAPAAAKPPVVVDATARRNVNKLARAVAAHGKAISEHAAWPQVDVDALLRMHNGLAALADLVEALMPGLDSNAKEAGERFLGVIRGDGS